MSTPPSTETSPWQTVWLRPTETMQRLLASVEGDYWATPLLMAGGILSALSPQMREQLLKLIPELTPQTIQPFALFLGILSGGLQAALWPALLAWCAKLLGGVTEGKRLRPARLAAAWSTLPLLVGYLLAPLGTDDAEVVLGGLNILLSIWSLVLLAHMLGTGYQMNPGRGALSVLLAGVFGFVAFFVLSFALLAVTAR